MYKKLHMETDDIVLYIDKKINFLRSKIDAIDSLHNYEGDMIMYIFIIHRITRTTRSNISVTRNVRAN